MVDLNKIIKASVLALEPYQSARGTHLGENSILMDANENPFDFKYSRYPDPYQSKLKVRIGKVRNINPRNIFLGNGSDEIIDLLMRVTCGPNDKILCLDPSYGMYKVSAAINDVQCDLLSMDEELRIDESALWERLKEESYKIVFICTPNNPDGSTVSSDLISQVLKSTNGLVVVDEAYIDFSDEESWTEQIQQYSNLLVLQTFSKSWAGAGLRVGIGYAQEWLIGILNKVKPPYNISSPAQALALQSLEDLDKINESIEAIKSERSRLQSELRQLETVEKVFESKANFLLVRFTDSEAVRTELLKNQIIVRDRSFQKNCESTLRISIGTPTENNKLLTILKNI